MTSFQRFRGDRRGSRRRTRPGHGPGRVLLCVLATLLMATGATAQSSDLAETPQGEEEGPREALRFDGGAGELDVRIPRLANADIEVDGTLDEPAWREAAVLAGFTQYEPNEGLPSVEPTEIRVLYTPEALYFGIHAYDSRPELISAVLGQRDRGIFGSDWIRILLDTFNDRRQAYLFYVNPLGIQADGLWIEGKQREGGRPPVDFNPDFIWESEGRVGEDGWVAEIRIPYESIQFPEGDGQTWGINVAREVRRLGYRQSWAPLTANQSSQLAQSGRLVGIGGISAPRLFELNPVMTSAINGERIDGDFTHGSLEPTLGLDGRYGLTRNLVLGGTFNPDFSQVEADADQITVNERFAIFFPEKRPFFLDGTEIFESPTRLVHTRQIVDPIGGAKLTGKVGGLNLAYLGALDESPATFDPDAGRALFNLARLRADVGTGSTVGALYTDRSVPGDGISNRVASADARFLLGGRLAVTGQLARSWTSHGSGTAAEGGALWFASIQQSGRRFGFQTTLEGVSPDFETDAGFIRRIGDIRATASTSLSFFTPPGSALESLTLTPRFEGFFDYEDFFDGTSRSPFERETELFTTLSFRGGRSVTFIARHGYFRFRPEDYGAYEIEAADGSAEAFTTPEPLDHMWAGGLFARWRFSETVSLGGRFFARQVPIFLEARQGFELQGGPDLSIRPTDGWQVQLSYTMSRIRRE
ncbi:MAG: DUF5916 domain-containing protein, partial [Gemmatimonadota bacterium]|nr:DUF5916 domain-containing protein [Gemmatimonadota bacterium]